MMELTQEEKMMLAAKQQILLCKAKYDDLTDEEYDAIAEEVHDNTVRYLIEANSEISELRELLQLARGHINFMLYDYKGPGKKLIQSDLLRIATYLEGDKIK